jgi:hypothetical protein
VAAGAVREKTIMNHRFLSRALVLAGASLLLVTASGCATRKPSMYYWNGYESQVYEYLKDGSGKSHEEQITSLEENIQKANARGATLPPGYHAHLGLLYAQVGKDDQVKQEFETEKALFPESATFMDFLLHKTKP